MPLGAYIPEERLKELEVDGVEAEILYTTLGFRLFRLTDAPFQQALFRAYNTWISEYCSYDSKHMIGLGMISLLDVSEGVRELYRCAKLGPSRRPHHGLASRRRQLRRPRSSNPSGPPPLSSTCPSVCTSSPATERKAATSASSRRTTTSAPSASSTRCSGLSRR